MEALNTSEVMASYGYADVAKAILGFTLRRLPPVHGLARRRAPTALATYYRLYHDRAYVDETDAGLARILRRLGRQVDGQPRAGSHPSRCARTSADDGRRGHAQIAVLQGLKAMARVWPRPATAGCAARPALRRGSGAIRAGSKVARAAARRLALRAAASSARSRRTDAQRLERGLYWNLVVPYALASGFFRPGGRGRGRDAPLPVPARVPSARRRPRADAHIDLRQASRTRPGRTRSTAQRRPAPRRQRPARPARAQPLRAARDRDDPGHVRLGRGVQRRPTRDAYYRKSCCRPTGGQRTFLETLRLILVHETRGPTGTPPGSTSRSRRRARWLADGKTIGVGDAPTSFGPVSYAIARHGRRRVEIAAPASPRLRRCGFGFGCRRGQRIATARARRASRCPSTSSTGTVDLSGWAGQLDRGRPHSALAGKARHQVDASRIGNPTSLPTGVEPSRRAAHACVPPPCRKRDECSEAPAAALP